MKQFNFIKLFAFILILLSFIIFEGIYNSSHNIKISIENLDEKITELMSVSKTGSYLENTKKIEELKYDLTHNKSIDTSINKLFNDFLSSWKDTSKTQKAHTLTELTIKNYETKNIELFTPIIASVKNTGTNQTLALVFIFIILSTFLSLAFYSNILRDIVNDPILKQQIQSANNFPPFSLSRTQLGVWITTIACFYIHAILWNQCSLTEKINTTALILMGISSGTFATGAIIDTLEIEQGTPRNQNQLSSGNFFKDILSDSQGISIHRFQNVVWTIIAIIVYFYAYDNHIITGCLPDLDNTLLALTGISSATYLTLKTRENIFTEAKIHLNVELPTEKALIDSQGWKETKITVLDANGKQATVTPDATSNFDFVISGLTPGNYSIKFSAKTVDSKAIETEFIGEYSGAINSTTLKPIPIAIKIKT